MARRSLRDTCTDPQVAAFMRRERPEALAAKDGDDDNRQLHDGRKTTRGRRASVVGAFVLGASCSRSAAIVLFGNFSFSIRHPGSGRVRGFDRRVVRWGAGDISWRPCRRRREHRHHFDPRPTSPIFRSIRFGPEPTAPRSPEAGRNTVDLLIITRGLRAELNIQSFVTGQSRSTWISTPHRRWSLHKSITNLPEIPTRQSTIQRAKEQLSQLPLRELADNANATLESLRGLSEKLDQNCRFAGREPQGDLGPFGAVGRTATQTLQGLQTKLDTTLASITQLADSGRQATQ